MLHSRDGGLHWSGVRGLSADNSGVGAVGFIPGTAEALASVAAPQWAPCTSRFMRSEDSGASWTQVYRGCLADGVGSLSFTDSTHGFAGGERLLVTIDGGRHWQRRIAQPAARAATATGSGSYARLTYSSRRYGSLLAGACQESRDYEAPCSGDVWTTADGGRSWRDGHLTALTVSSYRRTVVTVGGPTTPVGLSISRDGGRSWDRVVAPTDVRLAHLSGPGTDLLAISNGASVISSDAGRTWHRSAFPFLSANPYGALAEAGTVALSGSDHLERSSDAGHTWSVVHAPGGSSYFEPGSIAFNSAEASKVVALAEDADGNLTNVLTSKDSGRTWDLASNLQKSISSAVAYNGSTVVAPLSDGWVEVSHDDGRHWSTREVADDYDLTAATVSGSSIWVTGFVPGSPSVDRVVVAVSNDSGKTWTSHLIEGLGADPYERRFPAIVALSGHQALLTMADSSLWRTTDGGATWHQERPQRPSSDGRSSACVIPEISLLRNGLRFERAIRVTRSQEA